MRPGRSSIDLPVSTERREYTSASRCGCSKIILRHRYRYLQNLSRQYVLSPAKSRRKKGVGSAWKEEKEKYMLSPNKKRFCIGIHVTFGCYNFDVLKDLEHLNEELLCSRYYFGLGRQSTNKNYASQISDHTRIFIWPGHIDDNEQIWECLGWLWEKHSMQNLLYCRVDDGFWRRKKKIKQLLLTWNDDITSPKRRRQQ